MNMAKQSFVLYKSPKSHFVQAVFHRKKCRRDIQPSTMKIYILKVCNVAIFLNLVKNLIFEKLMKMAKQSFVLWKSLKSHFGQEFFDGIKCSRNLQLYTLQMYILTLCMVASFFEISPKL